LLDLTDLLSSRTPLRPAPPFNSQQFLHLFLRDTRWLI
jgi:hypothetical protein